MIKKLFSILVIIVIFFGSIAKADEGMWLLTLLNKNYEDMKAQGFKLTPEDIYSLNKPSLKDAIVLFGGYCTGEIISEEGLLLTNHHCGYESIQKHSSLENNYIEDGFWAKSKAEEIPTPDLYVRFLINIEEVTSDVLKKVTDDMTEAERNAQIEKNIEKIQKKSYKTYSKEDFYYIEIESYFEGNTYYKIVYQQYNDVRMVGAPPSSIGDFGSDTDNFMWPRHSGDFSMFRVYTSPEGEPAEYSENNIPLKPKYSLTISLKGYNENDFAMVLGYPANTDRYMSSFGITEKLEFEDPIMIDALNMNIELMLEDMLADEELFIKYATKQAQLSNYWKFLVGEEEYLKKLDVYDKKILIEKQFTDWLEKNPEKKTKYNEVLNLLEEGYSARGEYIKADNYLNGYIGSGLEFLNFTFNIFDLYSYLSEKSDIEQDNEILVELKNQSETFFKDYNPETDKKIAKELLKYYYAIADTTFHPSFFTEIQEYMGGDIDKFVDKLFSKSIFVDENKFNKFLENPTLDAITGDLSFAVTLSFIMKYYDLLDLTELSDDKINKGRRLYMAALMEMEPEKNFYSDANFTMRLTYGKVGDYKARDAVYYNYYTTLKGIMEKEVPGDWEFDVSPKLKELYENKDYGKYSVDGEMRVCFITNNDITGGNSGSPMMNGNGELIGLAFDGNWEGMTGDVYFSNELQKCIGVDIRYVLFIIDKFAGATNLINELKIVE
jgi:hypothetical protein